MDKGIYPFSSSAKQEKCQLCLPGFLGAQLVPWERLPECHRKPQVLQLQKWLPSFNGTWLQRQGDAGDPEVPLPGTKVERTTDEEADPYS